MIRFREKTLLLLSALTLALLLGSRPLRAQPTDAASPADAEPLTLTLREAVDVALTQSYALRNARLDVKNAAAQVSEAWGSVLPQVDASASYTRNIKTANPFAGSEAAGLFGGGVPTDWLGFNERARTDGDPSTEPISLQTFRQRQTQGRREAGLPAEPNVGGNPFSVPNQFQGGLRITQALYNGTAFAAIEGAQGLKDVNQLALDRQQQVIIRDVRQAYYRVLLAQNRAQVNTESVQRAQATFQDVALQVRQGVTPKAERLSTEVQLANARTQLVQARNQAASAKDNLKMAMGLEVERPIALQGDLEVENPGLLLTVSTENAADIAFERRPDFQRARTAVGLRKVQQNVTEAQYYPSVNLVADFNYSGRVPGDRTSVQTLPNDPFTFEETSSGFFSTNYWNPSVSVGLQVNWNLFNGFQTTARVQQDQVAVERAQLQFQQLQEQIRQEVGQAKRDLQSARSRLSSQDENVETARTNYEFARKRLNAGVVGQLRVREASQQLDTAQLNYLQAAYDYLAARAAFQTAMGIPLSAPGEQEFNLTSTN